MNELEALTSITRDVAKMCKANETALGCIKMLKKRVEELEAVVFAKEISEELLMMGYSKEKTVQVIVDGTYAKKMEVPYESSCVDKEKP